MNSGSSRAESRLAGRLDPVLRGMATVAAFIVALMAVGVGLDVFLRAFRLASLVIVFDLVEYGILALTALGAPYVLSIGRHVTVDFVVNNLPERPRRLTGFVAIAVGSVISLTLCLASIGALVDSYGNGTVVYKSLVVREWVLFLPLVICFALLTVEFLRQLCHGVIPHIRKKNSAGKGW